MVSRKKIVYLQVILVLLVSLQPSQQQTSESTTSGAITSAVTSSSASTHFSSSPASSTYTSSSPFPTTNNDTTSSTASSFPTTNNFTTSSNFPGSTTNNGTTIGPTTTTTSTTTSTPPQTTAPDTTTTNTTTEQIQTSASTNKSSSSSTTTTSMRTSAYISTTTNTGPPTTTADPITSQVNSDLNNTLNQHFNSSAGAQNALNNTINDIGGDKTGHLDGQSIYLVSKILQEASNVKNLTEEVFDLFLKTVDVLLNADFQKFNASDTEEDHGSVENSTYRIVYCFTNLVINTDITNGSASYLNGSNVGIIAQTVDREDGQLTNGLSDGSEGFKEFYDTGNNTATSTASEQSNPQVSISISLETILKSKATKVYFMIFRNQNLFVQQSPPPDNCDDAQRPPSSHVATGTLLGSNGVIELNASDSKLEHIVTIKFDLRYVYETLGRPFPLHGGHRIAYFDWRTSSWSKYGCNSGAFTDKTTFEGHCNHLTDFTILFQGPNHDPRVCYPVVTITGTVLGGISSVTLFLLIGIFVAASVTAFQAIPFVRRLSGSPKSNRLLGLPYLATLFCYFIIFTVLIDQKAVNTGNQICKYTAAVLYTCLISGVLWTIVQGIQIIELIFAFTRLANVLRIATNIYLASAICTGLPILLTVFLWLKFDNDFDGFFTRGDGFCWIRPDTDQENNRFLFYGVVLPTSLLVLCDVLFTVIIVYQLFFVNRMGDDENNRIIISPSARNSQRWQKITLLISMQIVLGAPWAFQYFAEGASTLKISHVLFTVFNGSQGFLLGLIYLLIRYKRHRGKHQYQHRQQIISQSAALPSISDMYAKNKDLILRTDTVEETLSCLSSELLNSVDPSGAPTSSCTPSTASSVPSTASLKRRPTSKNAKFYCNSPTSSRCTAENCIKL